MGWYQRRVHGGHMHLRLTYELASSYFVLLMKSHLQSYPSPLQINFFWNLGLFSGIILLFFLMATAFMGYVLPFGQMSFWGATVITNLLSPAPCLVEWICGGYCVHNPTLKRFF